MPAMEDKLPRLFHADSSIAFGTNPARFAWISFAALESALMKLETAAAAKAPLVLSRPEADALGVWFASKATALRNCTPGPALPIYPIDPKAREEAEKQKGVVSPMSGAGAIGLDPHGPILGFSDDSSRTILLACRAAVHELGPKGGGVVVAGAAPAPPPVGPGTTVDPSSPTSLKSAYAFGGSKGYADGYAGVPYMPAASAPAMAGDLRAEWEKGYSKGYTMGAADRAAGKAPAPPVVIGGGGTGLGGLPVIIGAIAGGAILVGGAIYVGTLYEKSKAESVKYQSAAVMHATDKAADLALERFRIFEATGKLPDASPLEKGAADAVGEFAKKESSSSWFAALLGLGLGVGGTIAGKMLADRFLGRGR